MRVKRLDKNGHSCLAENQGAAQWDPEASGIDVKVEFGRRVAKEYMDQGYLVVDEGSNQILKTVRELKANSEILLMPPVTGG